MPKIYTMYASGVMAYKVEDGAEGRQRLPHLQYQIEGSYLAVAFGLSEFVRVWQKEMDERQYDGEYKVATPSAETPRPLPPPIMVYCGSELVARQLRKEAPIHYIRHKKLAQQVWAIAKNMEVQYSWVLDKENLAREV